jgi:hypothetical protein
VRHSKEAILSYEFFIRLRRLRLGNREEGKKTVSRWNSAAVDLNERRTRADVRPAENEITRRREEREV